MIGRTVVLLSMTAALAEAQGLEYVRSHYTKYEYSLAMRDG